MSSVTDDLDREPPRAETVAQRWGEAAMAGFMPVPNSLMRAQAKLKLTVTQMVVLLNLLLHWWHSERMPFPSTPAIAKRSGLSVRTVQRSLRELEKKGLIARVRGRPQYDGTRYENMRARYDLTGLRDQLSELAQKDVWYRPDVVRQAPAGTERRARSGVQTREPEQP
jgi:predicted transcriptional regulator